MHQWYILSFSHHWDTNNIYNLKEERCILIHSLYRFQSSVSCLKGRQAGMAVGHSRGLLMTGRAWRGIKGGGKQIDPSRSDPQGPSSPDQALPPNITCNYKLISGQIHC